MDRTSGEASASSSGALRKRVVLADDHTIVAEGIRRILEPQHEIVAVVADGDSLVKAALGLKPDLVVTDITMPVRSGIDAVREIVRRVPTLPVIVLSMHADHLYLSESLEAGARGYVVKHAAGEELLEAARVVLRGGSFITPQLGGGGSIHGRLSAPAANHRAYLDLTPRQRRILLLIAEGRTTREIGDALNISSKTVEFHKYRTITGLKLKSTADLIRFAVRHGLVAK